VAIALVDIVGCAAFTKKRELYEWLWKFRGRRLLLIKPYDSVRSDSYQERALPTELCGPPAG